MHFSPLKSGGIVRSAFLCTLVNLCNIFLSASSQQGQLIPRDTRTLRLHTIEKQPCYADFPSGMLAYMKLRLALVQLTVTVLVNIQETLPCAYQDMSACAPFSFQLANCPDIKQILHICSSVNLFHESRSLMKLFIYLAYKAKVVTLVTSLASKLAYIRISEIAVVN